MYPLMLEGAALTALVVGGGDVAARKAEALLASGARVRLIASSVGATCRALGAHDRMEIEERTLREHDLEREIGDAVLVVAATDAPELNARIAAETIRLRRLVNVADSPASGNCIVPAVHRAGELTIAVSAGGVPGAASRIRDAIAARFDARYASAVASLSDLRSRLLGGEPTDSAKEGEQGLNGRGAWREAASTLLAGDFCESVERSTFAERVARWR